MWAFESRILWEECGKHIRKLSELGLSICRTWLRWRMWRYKDDRLKVQKTVLTSQFAEGSLLMFKVEIPESEH